jgi:hypothetical protein
MPNAPQASAPALPKTADSAVAVHPAMPAWPKDNTAAKNAFYGNFHAADWQTKFLTRITPPFQMYYAKKPMPSILVNRMCAPAFMSVFNDIWNACDHDQAKVNAAGASDFGGCFNIRPIAGSDNWSNHSWACAIDLSPGSNGFNVQKTTLGKIVVDTFKAHGARWGGDYRGRKDPMHFEFVSPA